MSCRHATIVPGDDWARPVTLYKSDDGGVTRTPHAVESGSVVVARLLRKDRTTELIGATVCPEAHADADWGNGVVVVQFSSAVTALLSKQIAVLKLSVSDGSTTSWHERVVVEAG